MKKARLFIAILPPSEIQDYVNDIKQLFAEKYRSKSALKSPPHITLIPPFEFCLTELDNLRRNLKEFAQKQPRLSITLENYSAFPPRVIFINVHHSQELTILQTQLLLYLKEKLEIDDSRSQNREFTPHLTVATKDLSETNFIKAWKEFEEKKVDFFFKVDQITLLSHNGQHWIIDSEYALSKESEEITAMGLP